MPGQDRTCSKLAHPPDCRTPRDGAGRDGDASCLVCLLRRKVYESASCISWAGSWRVGALAIGSSTVEATTPWQKLTLFKHIEADPNTDYLLTEDQGPWMIMAVTFCGVEAERQSKELVQELRSFYKMPAYRYKMDFDYQQGTVGRGVDRFGAPRKMKYRTDKSTEIGVLVGDFATHDDPTIQKVLKRLRYAQPECLDDQKLAKEGRSAAAALAGWRTAVEAALNPDESKRRGPMGRALRHLEPAIARRILSAARGSTSWSWP